MYLCSVRWELCVGMDGGYVLRTAFRRVYHANCWVVFK